jgi:hypothetical protein
VTQNPEARKAILRQLVAKGMDPAGKYARLLARMEVEFPDPPPAPPRSRSRRSTRSPRPPRLRREGKGVRLSRTPPPPRGVSRAAPASGW